MKRTLAVFVHRDDMEEALAALRANGFNPFDWGRSEIRVREITPTALARAMRGRVPSYRYTEGYRTGSPT